MAATTLSVAKLVASGALALDAPVARGLPPFGARGKEGVTVRELLGHRSGLPAWSPSSSR
ncbi:MAG: beta-lactamase family protein [Sandaracinaceae bacterium]|nr:beta-lactamase family protein [Sandaracinaceae bacterium]